eukprot:720043-Prymnesium_polylepis.3
MQRRSHRSAAKRDCALEHENERVHLDDRHLGREGGVQRPRGRVCRDQQRRRVVGYDRQRAAALRATGDLGLNDHPHSIEDQVGAHQEGERPVPARVECLRHHRQGSHRKRCRRIEVVVRLSSWRSWRLQ